VRLLLVNEFYPPDVAPTGRFLHALATTLVGRGHAVRVLASRALYATGVPGLPAEELRDGVAVHRVGTGAARRGLLRRATQAASFLGRTAYGAPASERPDVVVALTSPPFLGCAAARAARRHGARLVHWVMDAYPDALAAHGLLRPHGPVYALLRALARRAYARAALVVTLGPFMAARLRPLLGAATRLESVPLWGEAAGAGDADAARALRRALGWSDGDLVLLYSGNMGRGHRLGEFLEAARRLGARGPRFVFAGGGARRSEVEAFAAAHPTARLELAAYAGDDAHRARLLAGDVHLASLATPWQGVIAPSKLQAAFALARPVLFVGPPDNEAAAWLRESGGGWSVAEGDVDALVGAVAAARDAGERARRGAAASAYARAHFDRERNLARLAACIEASMA
jgi:glycosyltransferase involved in cell wall biosynthesis